MGGVPNYLNYLTKRHMPPRLCAFIDLTKKFECIWVTKAKR